MASSNDNIRSLRSSTVFLKRLRISPSVDSQAVLNIEMIFLTVFLHDELGHLLSHVHPDSLSHFHNVVERQLAFRVSKSSIHSSHGFFAQFFAFLVWLFAGKQVDESAGSDVIAFSCQSCDGRVVAGERSTIGVCFGSSGKGANGHFWGVLVLEVVN